MKTDRIAYIFLDIEQGKTEKNRNMEVGITVCDDEGGCEESFYGEADAGLRNEEMLCREIYRRFPSYRIMVVWAEDRYRIFSEKMKKAGISASNHRVILLKELMELLFEEKKEAEFTELLRWADMEFTEEKLEEVGYRTHCMKEIFFLMYRRYSEAAGNDRGCILNVSGRILHNEQCRYLNKISENRQIQADRMLIFSGYRPCKCCKGDSWAKFGWKQEFPDTKPESEKKREYGAYKGRKKQLTEKTIAGICEKFGMSYNISQGVVFIRSPVFSWRIYHDGCHVTRVLHENYRGSSTLKSKGGKGNEGFHIQKMYTREFYETVKYIYYHDRSYLKRKYRKDHMGFPADRMREECDYLRKVI